VKKWVDWLLCAVICGLGLLTKYNMAIFALSAIGYMWFFDHKAQFKNPRLWIMAVLALLILSPNIYWNYLNNFPTFSHTAGYVDKKGLYPGKMINFLLEQAGVIVPVGFIAMWWWMIKGTSPKKLLLVFSLPMLVIISLVALQGKYNANWAAPTYVAVVIGLAHFLQNRKRWLIAMLATNIALGLFVQLADPIVQATGIHLKAKQDPFKRVRGWKTWGETLKTYTDKYPDALFIADGRDVITEATFYTFGMPNKRILAWSPTTKITSHFQLTRPFVSTNGNQSALMVSKKSRIDLVTYFASVKQLGIVPRVMSDDKTEIYYVYEVKNFLGYSL